MKSPPISWLTLAALVVTSWSAWRLTRRPRLATRAPARPEALQTWEGEGGGLPDGGPGPGVAVVPRAAD